jgi:hypothetical protein
LAACRSGVSAVAVEAFMDDAGKPSKQLTQLLETDVGIRCAKKDSLQQFVLLRHEKRLYHRGLMRVKENDGAA